MPLYEYWYYIPKDQLRPALIFADIKKDIIDLGSIKHTEEFIVKKISFEAGKLGRIFLRFAPMSGKKDKWLRERFPSGNTNG